MRTHVTVERHLDVDPWPVIERFLRSPELWLPLPARPVEDDAIVTTAHLGPWLHEIRMQVGEAWSVTDAVTRPISWVPCDATGATLRTGALPGFTGRLTLRHAPGALTAALEGSYQPPGGALGSALDHALLRRGGDATARALLDDVIARMTAPANEEAPR